MSSNSWLLFAISNSIDICYNGICEDSYSKKRIKTAEITSLGIVDND